MSGLVVDASVGVKWLFSEAESSLAKALAASEHNLFAPDLVLVELGAAISKRVGRGQIVLTEGLTIFETAPRLFDRLVPTLPLLADAMAIAQALHHQLYDCVYLALAKREDTRLVTADAHLIRKVASSSFADRVVALTDV